MRWWTRWQLKRTRQAREEACFTRDSLEEVGCVADGYGGLHRKLRNTIDQIQELDYLIKVYSRRLGVPVAKVLNE